MIAAVCLLAYFLYYTTASILPQPESVGAFLRVVWAAAQGISPFDARLDPANVMQHAGWAVILVGLLVASAAVLSLETIRRHGAYRRVLRFQNSLAWKGSFKNLSRLILIAGLCGSVYVIKRFTLASEHFDYAGYALKFYSLGRLALFASLFLLFIGTGAAMCRLFGAASFCKQRAVTQMILGFFLGATAYSVICIALGFVGLLRLQVVLPLVVIGTWFGVPSAMALLARMAAEGVRILLRASKSDVFTLVMLAWCGAVMTLFIIATHGLYPVTLDNDVYEHYLHYLGKVLKGGSIGPNEVWYHYFLSKGAGAFFLAGLLSDEFAPQIVSMTAVCATLLIVYDMLLGTTRDRQWALLGVVVLASFLYGHDHSGAFFKHHGMLFAFTAFLCWTCFRIAYRPGVHLQMLVVAAVVCAGYLGYYLPPFVPVVGAMFVLTALFHWTLLQNPQVSYRVGLGALGLAAGCLLALVVNFLATGMAELVPTQIFWRLADQTRFDATIGASGVAYFDFFAGGLGAPVSERSFEWMLGALRLKSFEPILSPTMLLAGAAVILAHGVNPRNRQRPGAMFAASVPLLALGTAAGLLAWMVQIDSTLRMFVFMGLVLAACGVWILWSLLRLLSGQRLRRVFAIFVIVAAAASMVSRALESGSGRLLHAALFLTGHVSLAQGLVASEQAAPQKRMPRFPQYLERLVEYRTAKTSVGPAARLLALTNDVGFAYLLPDPNMMSEPSYSIGPNFLSIVEENSDAIAARLRAMRVDVLILNLQVPLFSYVPFTELFSSQSMSRYFQVAFAQGDTYVLTWKDANASDPLPDRLLQILELKRAAVLHLPFSASFEKEIHALAEQSAIARVAPSMPTYLRHYKCLEACEQFFMSVVDVLRRHFDVPLQERGNIRLLRRIAENVGNTLTRESSNLLGRTISQTPPGTRPLPRTFAATLAKLTLEQVHGSTRTLLEQEFGTTLASVLSERDERRPFGLILESLQAQSRGKGND